MGSAGAIRVPAASKRTAAMRIGGHASGELLRATSERLRIAIVIAGTVFADGLAQVGLLLGARTPIVRGSSFDDERWRFSARPLGPTPHQLVRDVSWGAPENVGRAETKEVVRRVCHTDDLDESDAVAARREPAVHEEKVAHGEPVLGAAGKGQEQCKG